MAEAKRRRADQLERLRSALCVYCAGEHPANTLDHMPPRALFDRRHRPSGLEFPSCEACNRGTRECDQVVAMMSRVQIGDNAPEIAAELRKYMAGVANNQAGLLEEMAGPLGWRPTVARQVPAGQHALFAGGPILNRHMNLFAAKFGLAMHYEFLGQAVPREGGVVARWYSNANNIEAEIPAEMWQALGPAKTLQQGRFQVAEQFAYSGAVADDHRAGMYVARFRRAFAVVAFSANDLKIFDEVAQDAQIWRPGSLRAQPQAAA